MPDEVAGRFLDEAQITAQLDHPNIVTVYALESRPDGTKGYAMKLVQGKELAKLIEERSVGTALVVDKPLTRFALSAILTLAPIPGEYQVFLTPEDAWQWGAEMLRRRGIIPPQLAGLR